MRFALIAAAMLAGGIAVAAAQSMSGMNMNGMDHQAMMARSSGLHESGQSAFGAITEIITQLEADPNTDWSHVDIGALRQHLIDMNEVTLNADIREEPAAGSIRYVVTGNGRTRDSIQRMVVGHARSMGDAAHWTLTAEQTADGAIVTARPKQPGDLARIHALGLLGMMAEGSHHQTHHWMLANEAAMH